MSELHRAVALVVLSVAQQSRCASVAPGMQVYAAPADLAHWYSGCTILNGPNDNNFYLVRCADNTSYRIAADHLRTDPPQAVADPMRPGQMMRLTIVPSDSHAATAVGSAPAASSAAPAPGPGTYARPAVPDSGGPGTYAEAIRLKIAADAAASRPRMLPLGKYECRAGGQYTFTDLIIRSATRYEDSRGNGGEYRYADGALTFTSGPYQGAYSRMVDGTTIGVSAAGSTDLGTQCGLVK